MEWLCELILTSLQASSLSSGNARRQSANWKLLIWCGRLSAWICLDLQKQHHMHSACCIPASGRDECDIVDHAKLVCAFSQPLQMLSPKALCKRMHECLTQALMHGCRLHQEPLDLLPGVFQVQTLRHKLQRLERVIFVRSLLYLHSCPKRAPCSSLCGFEALTLQVDFKWFQTITKLIRRDAFSANISLASFHKNWSLIGREKLHCWYWKNRAMAMSVKILHWGPLIALGFGSRLVFSIIIENRFNWREVVPGNVSLPFVERWPWGVRQITHCRCGGGGQRFDNRFGSDRRLHVGMVVLRWQNLTAFACGNSNANRDF